MTATPDRSSPRRFSFGWWIPLLMSLTLLGLGFAALDQYNITWDEGVGDLFFGQRNFLYFTSGNREWLQFDRDLEVPAPLPDLDATPLRTSPQEHYPVASTLATAVSLLSTRLELTDPFDGIHLFNLLLAAPFLFFFFRLIERERGRLTAVAATLFLFTSPRIVFAMMANVKDFPEMILFAASLGVFWIFDRRSSPAGVMLGGVLWGLALGTKANAWFVPPIILLYLIVSIGSNRRSELLRRWLPAGVAVLLGLAVLVMAWPWLQQDPIARLLENLRYNAARAGSVRPDVFAPPLRMLLFTTPLPFLASALGGLVLCVAGLRRTKSLELLALLWIAVVGVRVFFTANFDGVRHFLEIFPPLAFLGGVGVNAGVEALRRFSRAWIAGTAATVLLVLQMVPMLLTHPFEAAYWNSLAGGARGARERNIPQSGDYWAASYRLGMRWLNENAPEHSALVVPISEHKVRLVAPDRLRGDIDLLHTTSAASPRVPRGVIPAIDRISRERAVFVMFVPRREWMNALTYRVARASDPVAVWSLEGEPLLLIYRWPQGE